VLFTISMIGAGVLAILNWGAPEPEQFLFPLISVIGTVGQFFLCLRLVAWFSLRMKWGGLPAALALGFLANLLAIPFVFLMMNFLAFVIVPAVPWFVAGALKGPLHRRI